MGFKVGLYNFLTSNRHAFSFVLPLAREAVELYLYLLIPLIVIILTFNLPKSNRLLGNSIYTSKSNLLAVSFVRAIYAISFINGLNEAL